MGKTTGNVIRNTIYTVTVLFSIVSALMLVTTEGVFASSSTWPSFRGNSSNNGIVSFSTPMEQKLTDPVWTRVFKNPDTGKASSAYAPCMPIIVEGDVITTSGRQILRLDPETGKTIDKGSMSGAVSGGMIPPTFAEMEDDRTGIIFVPQKGGCIEAFDADELSRGPLWTFRLPGSSSSHQSLSPIVYSDGMVYTGFFAGSYDQDDSYVAVAAREITIKDPVTGEEKEYSPGELVWRYESKGGFYWNGALALENAVITGTQDGLDNNDMTGGTGSVYGDSKIVSLDKKTGRVISEAVLPEAGDILSSIVYDKTGTGRIFWTSSAGYICSAAADPETGEISDVKQQPAARKSREPFSVSTPVAYGDRLYFCFKAKDKYGYARTYFAAYDLETLSEQFKAELPRYTVSSPLVTNAYEKSTEYLYAYLTDQNEPGGLTVVKFKGNATDDGGVTVSQLFAANGYEKHGKSSVVADNMGQLYYTNDGGAMFSMIRGKKTELGKQAGLKVAPSEKKFTISYTKNKKATRYRVLYRINETGSFKKKYTAKTKYTVKISKPTVITVKVRAEHIDEAKKVFGTYSDPVTVYAAKSRISKMTAGEGSFTVTYNKHKIADGYQIQYSTAKNMKYAPTFTNKGASKTKQEITGLLGKKTYYVRVRSYKVVNQVKQNGKWVGGTTLYGDWSPKKKVTTKEKKLVTPTAAGDTADTAGSDR